MNVNIQAMLDWILRPNRVEDLVLSEPNGACLSNVDFKWPCETDYVIHQDIKWSVSHPKKKSKKLEKCSENHIQQKQQGQTKLNTRYLQNTASELQKMC